VFEIAPEPAIWFENKTVQFASGVEGHIESLAIPLEPAVAPIIFRRLPEPEMVARSFLEPLTGVYRIGNIAFRIGIDEAGRLTFTRNEAATERLLARHGSIFGFADSEFFRIEFRRNAAGEVDALLSHEPTGTISGRARRRTAFSSAEFAVSSDSRRKPSPTKPFVLGPPSPAVRQGCPGN